jgi:hypothetical protein
MVSFYQLYNLETCGFIYISGQPSKLEAFLPDKKPEKQAKHSR